MPNSRTGNGICRPLPEHDRGDARALLEQLVADSTAAERVKAQIAYEQHLQAQEHARAMQRYSTGWWSR